MDLEFSIFWDFSQPSLPSARVPQESFSRCARGCRVVTLKIPDGSREVEGGMKFQTFLLVDPTRLLTADGFLLSFCVGLGGESKADSRIPPGLFPTRHL